MIFTVFRNPKSTLCLKKQTSSQEQYGQRKFLKHDRM